MNTRNQTLRVFSATALMVLMAGLSAPAKADLDISQVPLSIAGGTAVPPLNMLVMGKDHKNYYEAYNDASDLNGDGKIDVGYKPDTVEYYGYFNSKVCYTWGSGRFNPSHAASGSNGKECPGSWSGDFLNYATTGRLDAMRKVLYGGWRETDTDSLTVLQGAFFPQDAHSWGKEYQSTARDGYDISRYTPLSAPLVGRYHLFAVTTFADNSAPTFRVLENTLYRIWNWVSIEGPVADATCFTTSNSNVDCTRIQLSHPGHPNNRAAFDTIENSYAIANYKLGNDQVQGHFECTANCNWSTGQNDNYMTIGTAKFRLQNNANAAGTYEFCIDGDDAVDVKLYAADGTTPISGGEGGNYGGHGFEGAVGNCTGSTPATVALLQNTTYTIKARHEEATGGDGFRLQWRKTVGANQFGWEVFSIWTGGNGNKIEYCQWNGTSCQADPVGAANAAGHAFIWQYYTLQGSAPSGATLTDYRVRVQVCPSNAALREDNCKVYGNGTSVKPTGILHDFGEIPAGKTDPRMYFGLLTGSQGNNTRGGVLRRNLGSFADEVDADTGVFLTNVEGIARTLDRFRMIGGGYAGKTRTRDTSGNWAWGNGNGNCESQGYRALSNGECRMWGNPVGEMMLETLKYLAGGTATSDYVSGGSSQGIAEETTLGLPAATWKDPYKSVANGGLGNLACAKPVITVISDINPSYDSDVPGNPWGGAAPTLPAPISDFSLATEGQKMWNNEFGGGSRSVTIGELAAGYTDGAPTVKTASSFGNIRGLSPEEPSKQGSYSTSALAYYGWTKTGGINALSESKVRTYGVALASPLPRIEFPSSGGVVTLVPFAKTASGTFGTAAQKPTNTIVDFYVQEYANFPGQTQDMTINTGRPYAVFRINYEDVEQGNDHDMDAVVRYEVIDNGGGTVNVNLTSEYAAGSANQNMGFIMSGTTKDGVYLEVRDVDSTNCIRTEVTPSTVPPTYTCGGGHMYYGLNTPPGQDPGYCVGNTTDTLCAVLPLASTRSFTVNSDATDVTTLRDPIWYAAKYGGFSDRNGNALPDLSAEWDANNDGNPDNYFLVTNALSLKEELNKAFSKILADTQASGGVAASGARADTDLLAYVPQYNSSDWTGDLRAHKFAAGGALAMPAEWSASELLESNNARNLYFVDLVNGTNGVSPFTQTGLGGNTAAATKLGLGTPAAVAAAYSGATVEDVIDYLSGDHDNELRNGGHFRDRASRLGDIYGSQPTVLNKASYGYTNLPNSHNYANFVRGKQNRASVVFVGSNDGFLHAFDASENGGDELFAIAPSSVLSNMGQLASPDYIHRYYVDGSPTQGDAYVGGGWKTIVLAPTGAGGRSVMAVDATNPATAKVLWEFKDADLGLTIGQAKIAAIKNEAASGEVTWVAVFGNGYNSDNHKAFLYIVNLANGALLAKIPAGDNGTEQAPNALATPTVADVDYDGIGDVIYAGDYYGDVWRFTLNSYTVNSGSPVWTVPTFAELTAAGGFNLFTATDAAGVRQPITGGVDRSAHPARGGLVYVGTGKYFLTGDNAAPVAGDQVQSFYAIWDDPQATTYPIVRNNLVAAGNAIDWTESRGWVQELRLGERFIATPTVFAGTVNYYSFMTSGDQCEPGGTNYLWSQSVTSGNGMLGGDGTNQAVGGSNNPITGAPTVIISQGGGVNEGDCTRGGTGCTPTTPTPGDADGDGNPDDINMSTPGACVVSADLLTASGLQNLFRLACGRQSWRQIDPLE